MELEIKSKREVPLLSRTRVSGLLNYQGKTPALLDVKSKVASTLKVQDSLVVVRHVYQRFGLEKAKVIAHVYTKSEDLMKMEDKKSLIKNNFVQKEEKKQ